MTIRTNGTARANASLVPADAVALLAAASILAWAEGIEENEHIVAAIACVVVTTGLVPGVAHATPPTPIFGPAIDAYAAYDGQDTCDPTAKPPVVDFKNLLTQTYGRPNLGIVRACHLGGQSEHKEGRALDYPFDAFNGTELAQAQDLLSWLLATDQYGNPHALARRLGIMYIIWNRQQWRAYRPELGWQPYSGDNPHTDHIHFSFSRAGALRRRHPPTAASSTRSRNTSSADSTYPPTIRAVSSSRGTTTCGVDSPRHPTTGPLASSSMR